MKRMRFSLKAFLITVGLFAATLGLLIYQASSRIRAIEAYRDEGAIVYFAPKTPSWLKSLGVEQIDPFFMWSRVELCVRPIDGGVSLGDTDDVLTLQEAKREVLTKIKRLRGLGVDHIDLGTINGPNQPAFFELLKFGVDHSDASVAEDPERYQLRLKANRETGKNTNPEYKPTTPAPAPPADQPPLLRR